MTKTKTQTAAAVNADTTKAPRMKTSAKAKLLREVLDEVARREGFAGFADEPLCRKVQDALTRTAPRISSDPAERAAQKAAKRASKQLDRMVAWLKLDGVKAGGFAVRRGDSVIVSVVTDPIIEGDQITMTVKGGPKGEVTKVDAMQYRPDFTKVPVTPKAAKRQAQRDEARRTAKQ